MVVVPIGNKLPGGTPVRVTVTEQPPLTEGAPNCMSLTCTLHEFALLPVEADTAAGAEIIRGAQPIAMA